MRGIPVTNAVVQQPHPPFPLLWNTITLEWSPRIATAIESGRLKIPSPSSSTFPTLQFVFPDLPNVYTAEDRRIFLDMTTPSQRIHTIAACHHTSKQSLVDLLCRIQEEDEQHANDYRDTSQHENVYESSINDYIPSTILLVGGNDKGRSSSALTTLKAAEIIVSNIDECGGDGDGSDISRRCRRRIWGVENPNDPSSPQRFQTKLNVGIEGFLTQPLLASTAMDTLHTYHELLTNHAVTQSQPQSSNDYMYTLLAGMALPTSAKSLQFWARLLEAGRLEEGDVAATTTVSRSTTSKLEHDPLFQSHLAYFSQHHYTSLAWSGRELQDLYVRGPAAAVVTTTTTTTSRADDSNKNDHETMSPTDDRDATSTTTCSMIDHGVHFMPLKNISTLCDIFQSIWRSPEYSS